MMLIMDMFSLSKDLIQNVIENIPEVTWPSLVAALLAVCILTRIVTGWQSCRGKVIDPKEPRDVKMIGYWVPWLGHGISFAWDHITLLEKARNSTNEPVFGIRLDGKKHNVVLAPSMSKAVLSFRGTSSAALINYAMEKVFGDRGPIRNLNPFDHHVLHHNDTNLLMRESFINDASATAARLVQRETANLVTFSQSIVDQTPWERSSQVTVVNDSEGSACEADFFALVRTFVGYNTTSVLMGQAFMEAYPDMLEDVWKLDNQFTKLSMGIPRWLLPGISAAHGARERLLHILAVFHKAFAAWDDGVDPGVEFRDLDDVSEPVKQRIRTSRKFGLSPNASAPGHLSVLWGMNGNTPNIVFWNLLHIYSDPALLKEIREEVQPYANISRPDQGASGFPFQEPPKLSIDMDGLVKSCPLLKASFYETLRLDSAGFSFRELTSDLTLKESAEDAAIDGQSQPRTYKLPKGETVVIPYGVYHNDDRYFSNPAQYDPLRFILTDPETGAKRADMQELRPFDGGMSGCKGRVFAERQSLALIAAILSMWNIEPVDGKEFKTPDHKASSGAFLPKKDIRVKLRSCV